MQTTKLIRPLMIVLFVSALGGCGGYYDEYDYYPTYYPWSYTPYGTVTVVRRPVRVVDGWTRRTFRYRPYRGYRVVRHHSPSIVYRATKGDDVLEVVLTPEENSQTKVEVKALKGDSQGDKEQAKILMGRILQKYKK